MQSNDMRIFIRIYTRNRGKTDLVQYNKKINFDVHNKGRIILLEETCFPFAISVFFKCFEIKHSRNLLGSKYDSTMVTFNSCTDTHYISAAQKFLPVFDSTCSIVENDEFWNK